MTKRRMQWVLGCLKRKINQEQNNIATIKQIVLIEQLERKLNDF